MNGRVGGLLLLLGVLIGGWFYFGGSADAPDNTPKPKAPTTDEAASGLQKFFDNIADAITGWNDGTWRILALLALVGLGVWVFKKVPMVVWLVIAVVGAIIAVQL